MTCYITEYDMLYNITWHMLYNITWQNVITEHDMTCYIT